MVTESELLTLSESEFKEFEQERKLKKREKIKTLRKVIKQRKETISRFQRGSRRTRGKFTKALRSIGRIKKRKKAIRFFEERFSPLPKRTVIERDPDDPTGLLTNVFFKRK